MNMWLLLPSLCCILSNPCEAPDHRPDGGGESESRWCVVDAESVEGNVWGCFREQKECALFDDALALWPRGSRATKTTHCEHTAPPTCITLDDPNAGLREECYAGNARLQCEQSLPALRRAGWSARCMQRWPAEPRKPLGTGAWCAQFRGRRILCHDDEAWIRQYVGNHEGTVLIGPLGKAPRPSEEPSQPTPGNGGSVPPGHSRVEP